MSISTSSRATGWSIAPGNLALIDFEHAHTDLPARDFVRLRIRVRPSRPRPTDAFFYGKKVLPHRRRDELVGTSARSRRTTAPRRGRRTGDPALTAAGRATLRQLRERQW